MGREVRRVPPDWQHPKDERGRYRPLHGGSFSQRLAEWNLGNSKWQEGLRENFATDGEWEPLDEEEKQMSYAEWAGSQPESEDYMPDWQEDQRTHYQMYEDTSEGTPISPVMATPEELARWLVDNKASAFANETASYESWLRVAYGGFAPGMVMDAAGLRNGVDGLS